MKYKIILFDADGVTIDSNIMFSQKLESDYGITSEKTGSFFKGVFQECMFGRADLKEELGKVIKDWGWTKSVDEMLKEWFDFENLPNKEMFELIKQLREDGVKCYLATNQEKYRGEYMRKEMHFDELFDGLFISAEVGYKKKDPRFFEEVYRELNQVSQNPGLLLNEKGQVLFIDNEEENIKSAKEFGIQTHLFTNINELKKVLAG
ncbi:MAG: HAD family hydrolase [Patescibacteria group bacterium]